MSETQSQSIEQQLSEAQTAYHELLTGQSVVKLKRGDREMQYTPANQHQLKNYIDQLKAQQIGHASRRPLRFSF